MHANVPRERMRGKMSARVRKYLCKTGADTIAKATNPSTMRQQNQLSGRHVVVCSREENCGQYSNE